MTQVIAVKAQTERGRRRGEVAHFPHLDLRSYTVSSLRRLGSGSEHYDTFCEATIHVGVDGQTRDDRFWSDGDGPVNALEKAFKEALKKRYPKAERFRMVGYTLKVIGQKRGSASKVRVEVEMASGWGRSYRKWTGVGVHTNSIEASYRALAQAFELGLK